VSTLPELVRQQGDLRHLLEAAMNHCRINLDVHSKQDSKEQVLLGTQCVRHSNRSGVEDALLESVHVIAAVATDESRSVSHGP
jgi:hypothetical protein